MVLSFWLLPGLDACPADDAESAVAAAQSVNLAAGGQALLSSLSSSMSAETGISDLDDELMGTEDAYWGSKADLGVSESCFEGARLVGSVRTLLQVRSCMDCC